MGATLDAIRALQDIELQIIDIRRQLDRRGRQAATQQKKIDTLRAELDRERAEIRRSQIEFDALDVEIKSRSANIAKLREHLNSVRTNKEYQSVLVQMNTEKADATKVESRAMELMTALEERKKGLASREGAIASEEAKHAELVGAQRQAEQTYSGRLKRLETERAAAARALSPQLLATFERLSERHDGEIIAAVERTNPRADEFACGGCYMMLRVDVVNALKTSDDVQTCKNCGRVLVLNA